MNAIDYSKMGRPGRGYEIVATLEGKLLPEQPIHCYGFNGELPDEWAEIKNDTRVTRAVLFPSTQRRMRKPRLTETYTREVVSSYA